MVNLGGSDDNNKNEDEDMGKSNANNMLAQSNDAMGNKNNEHDVGGNIIGKKEGFVHREVMEKKIVSKNNLQ